ncbi:MAG: glycosyltransferase [Anaerolineae bacterium]|nr:glycosyltransferase [Anaerolineae bacterium]
MNVLYHVTMPPSPLPTCDAVVQEVDALRGRFGGEVVHLYPGRTPGSRIPRRWWGLQRLPALRWLERQVDLHHVFNPDPFPFPVLRWLRRPVVYTVVAGVRESGRDEAQRLARRVHTLVVPTPDDLARLQGWSIDNAALVRPGLDLAHFSCTAIPAGQPPTLLLGSAPWTVEQFHSKGVEALLELAQGMPELHLVLLWRGLLVDEIARRVRARGLEERVEVLNRQVDVNQVLARVHAAVALAADETLIKAYPHSLLEALAAGRPVLVSRSIPMAACVERERCGVVVEGIDAHSLRAAVQRLLDDYAGYRQRALAAAARTPTLTGMLDAYQQIYKAAGVACER